jgi:amino acid adenylation domain-containing protein
MSSIIASFAVLKSGRPFVPIDYSIPPAKLARILQDFAPRVICCDQANLGLANQLASQSAMVIDVDNLDVFLSESNPGLPITATDLAYIHYTSGSTGEPKGVMASHRDEIHNIMTNTNALHISSHDRISLVRSNNVGATRDTLLALLNGAALLPLDLKDGSSDLGRWLAEESITVFTCVTSVFRLALKNVRNQNFFSKLRLIHVGGEAITKSDVELFKKYFSDTCLFVTRLGLSETETLTYYFMRKHTEIAGEHVPVGYPLEGNEILIVDEDGNDLGVNQVGEIAVRSRYLSVGYWNQPELTRSKFVADPRDETRRTYFTGDLGYRIPDGCLFHVGRKDFQVKVRGHRVEVSAVERALLEIPKVKQGVIVPWRDSRGANRLVAYVVPQDDGSFGIGDLRGLLQAKLAPYMLPSRYIVVDSLPLTPGGKVDRRALPLPEIFRPQLETPYVQPRTHVEKALCNLCAEVLGVNEIGINDSFFDLGGDSLLATQLTSEIIEKFAPKRPVNIYALPTVSKIAEFLGKDENQPGEADAIARILLQIESIPSDEIEKVLEERRGIRDRA